MRVFVLGATGAVGSHLVPLLVSRGHEVVGATRSPEKLSHIRGMGAEAIVVDALNRDALVALVQRIRPHVIHHQMTAIPARLNLARFDEEFTETNRLRT